MKMASRYSSKERLRADAVTVITFRETWSTAQHRKMQNMGGDYPRLRLSGRFLQPLKE
jgi:hypothetical protein